MNPTDIRLVNREESWLAWNINQIIATGHPADREIVRRQALERITQYAGSVALSHMLPLYESIFERVEAAILCDAPRHTDYLRFCITRDERLLERARDGEKPFLTAEAIEASIARYQTRIAEIEAALLSREAQSSTAGANGRGTSAPAFA